MSKKQSLINKKNKKKFTQDYDNEHQENQSGEKNSGQDLFDKPIKEKNKDGQEFWSLTRNKRVSVSKFKGKIMVNFRQYFQKEGQWLPTKKGISLSKQSWQTFKKIIQDIDQAIQKAQK